MVPNIRFSKGAVALVVTVIALVWPLVAFAQAPTMRVVVLDVKPGGTDALADEFAAIEGVEVKRQQWFVGEIRDRDVQAKKIMGRPEDLRWLMSAAGITHIVNVEEKGDVWEGSVYDDTGDIAIVFEAPRGADEFDAAAAVVARSEFEALVGLGSAPVDEPTDATPSDEDDVDEGGDAEVGEPAPVGAAAAPALSLGLAGRMFKRDVTIAGDNGAAVSFRSAFYPGASLRAALFPSGLSIAGGTGGFFVDADAGFDSISPADGDAIPVLHLELAGGAGVRVPGDARLRLLVGARHGRFTLPSNDIFPSLVHTSVTLTGRMTPKVGPVQLDAEVELVPFALHHAGGDLFGERAQSFGFGSRIAVVYPLGAALGIAIGARARVLRTSFPGQGGLDFRDSNGFELVWGPEVGITYRD